MKVEIDQSGKVENTKIDTIVALSNHIDYTIRLHRKDKRILEIYFRENAIQGRSRYRVFAAIVAILLSKVIPKSVLLDNEYEGHQHFIYQHIMQYLRLLGIRKKIYLQIGSISKNSKADILAGKVGKGKKRPDYTVSLTEVFSLLQS